MAHGEGSTLDQPHGIPVWVHSMGLPVWITNARGAICYLNQRAEALFGHTLREWNGRPCHLCIGGETYTGAICGPACHVRELADARAEIEPIRMCIPAARDVGEVSVVVITAGNGDDRLLVHCVVDDERDRRIRRFIDGVFHRNLESPAPLTHGVRALTQREEEVLSLLAADLNLHEIAGHLSVSYATVRNHVAHILGKLGVHSILEAVAVWVMEGREQ